MRVIRFRAWDKACERMVNPERHVNNWRLHMDGTSSINDVWATSDLILMQFTGLQDVNGVDIYEGDLIEVRQKSDTGFVREKPTNVYYEESDAAFLLKLPRSEYPMYLHEVAHGTHITIEGCSHTCKVIGNIHENPDLWSAA